MSEDLETLIHRYLEGLATDEEIRRLDERLRRDPAARRALFLAADQDAELRRLLAEERHAETLRRALPAAGRRWILPAAAAATIAMAALALILLRSRPAPPLPPFDSFIASPAPAAPRPTAAPAPPTVEEPSRPTPPEERPAPEKPPAATGEPSEMVAAEIPEEAVAEPDSSSPLPSLPSRETPRASDAPANGETVAVVARLTSISGRVLLLTPAGTRPARPGTGIAAATGLETSESGTALLRYPDGTEIKLAENTLVERLSADGRQIHLEKGLLFVSAAPQPHDRPLVVATPQARAEILGTRFTISTGADATRLEVDEGRVRLVRTDDGASVEVASGFMALAAPGWPLRAMPQEDVDPVKVEAAIRKGVEYLRGKRIENRNGNVLIFLTLVHAGVPDSDPEFQALLKDALETNLEYTYQVALTAMAFEEYDRVKYQPRIFQCAQFLADNIGPKGQTRYGQPTTFVEGTPTTATAAPKPAQKTGLKVYDVPAAGLRGPKPPVTRFIQVKQKRPGPPDHDHSNMQYAALGLRACHDAGMRFEPALLKLIDEWWREAQDNDAGAKAEPLTVDPPPTNGKGPGSTKALATTTVAPQGWGYQKNGEPRGSMTAGAVGALCILDYLQGKDWRQDRDVLEGLQWLAKNFSVTENPKVGDKNYYYYMYGLERAGVLFGTETIGSHRWYREGAKVLLERQDADGKWNNAVNTCFAILFLKRATRPLVATGDSVRRK